MDDATPIRVMALHALVYCERLFFLEEVEEIRVADAAVWAGRRLHLELGEDEDVTSLTLESATLGVCGRVDAVRRRDGSMFPVEHKRGRCHRDTDGDAKAWDTDVVQVVAYAMLLEEHLGAPVAEARVRYHADAVTVRVPLGATERTTVLRTIARARELSASTSRPPVTAHEGRCTRCSLAPVCLPEEARFAEREATRERRRPLRLFPADTARRSLHVVAAGARVGRSGETLVVTTRDGETSRVGLRDVSDVVLHGFAQISTQALRTCAAAEVPVHLMTGSGGYVGAFAPSSAAVQRRIRQFSALGNAAQVGVLAQRIVAKLQMQIQHLLRASRGDTELRGAIAKCIDALRGAVRAAARTTTASELLGHEGNGARAYFQALASLVLAQAGAAMRPHGRSRRPPTDRFNALLSLGYSLLYRDVVGALMRVGLEPSFGILHQPRSSAYPLALDLMELFRVPCVDMAVLGAVNRRSFDADADFRVTERQVWLSDEGRRKLIELYERRKQQEYRHPVLEYSVSYARMIELEARLLEKEWSGEPGLFATFRLR